MASPVIHHQDFHPESSTTEELFAQAGERAKKEIDKELREARKRVIQLLNDIVVQAGRRAEDEFKGKAQGVAELLEGWKKEQEALLVASGGSYFILEQTAAHSILSSRQLELNGNRASMVENKRGLRGKKTNIIAAFEPVNVTKKQVRAAWRKDLERDLKVLKKWTTETQSFKSLLECSEQFVDAYKKTVKETKQAQKDADLHPEDKALRMKAVKLTNKINGYIRDDRKTKEILRARANASSTWAKKVEDTLLDFVDSSSDHELNTAAIRVKYELRKLINLLEAGQPPFYQGNRVNACFALDDLKDRVKAWEVPHQATSHSLMKTRIAKRMAELSGVPHAVDADGFARF